MIYSILFVLLVLIELVYFKLATYFKIKDKPNERSSHSGTPLLGGGVIFIVAVILYATVFSFGYPWMLIGALLLAVVSFTDDIKPLSPRFRLIIQVVSLMVLFIDLDLYTLPLITIGLILFITTGVLNAYNFMDGINGMMGISSMVVIAVMIYINSSLVPFVDANFLYVLLMALVIFNFFNFRKQAFCFAGDVGAFTMGFVMVFLISKLIMASGSFTWIALLAVFGVDTILTIAHRIMLKENISHPHRKHLFQLLANEVNIPHTIVSLSYAMIQLVVIVGLIAMPGSYLFAVSSILVLSIAYVLIKQKYYYLHTCNKSLD